LEASWLSDWAYCPSFRSCSCRSPSFSSSSYFHWGIALGVLGLLLLIARGLNAIAKKAGTDALEPIATGLHIAFRWVLTFGGFAGRIAGKAGEEQT
jgi:MYXO-CTERM domain-containing protein